MHLNCEIFLTFKQERNFMYYTGFRYQYKLSPFMLNDTLDYSTI